MIWIGNIYAIDSPEMDIHGDFLTVAATVVLIFAVIHHLYDRVKPHAIDKSLPGPKRHPLIGILKFFLDKIFKWR